MTLLLDNIPSTAKMFLAAVYNFAFEMVLYNFMRFHKNNGYNNTTKEFKLLGPTRPL